MLNIQGRFNEEVSKRPYARFTPRKDWNPMFVFFAGIAALSVAAIAGSAVVVKRDGYRQVPTRTYALLP